MNSDPASGAQSNGLGTGDDQGQISSDKSPTPRQADGSTFESGT